MYFDPARAMVSGQTCFKYSSNQHLYRATVPKRLLGLKQMKGEGHLYYNAIKVHGNGNPSFSPVYSEAC